MTEIQAEGLSTAAQNPSRLWNGVDSPGWCWVNIWVPYFQKAQWAVGYWTGTEWVLPGGSINRLATPLIIDIGVPIDQPTAEMPPEPCTGRYWWYKSKAQPNTWNLGFAGGFDLVLDESGQDCIDLQDVAVVGPDALYVQEAEARESRWYWVKLQDVDDPQQSRWSVGKWTGNEWIFPGIGANEFSQSQIRGFSDYIDDPSTEVAPPDTVSEYWWYKTKAQPDTWVIGWGYGDHFLDSALDSISLDDIAVVCPGPITFPG